ncbi:MAG: hypothetical protein HC898_10295 [Phycisphaerales bacterium]|nr:hypothetical protein [Phycisphaerales bacterium]
MEMLSSQPLAYLITIHTYGSWLPGRAPGYVDRRHNQFGESILSPDRQLHELKQKQIDQKVILLNKQMRHVVDQAIREHLSVANLALEAMHVRTNHVHMVVQVGDISVEKIMLQCKAWATRRLRENHCLPHQQCVWSRHGSTRYLWNESQVQAAVHYVLHEQGAPLD